ncbi:MAG: MlaD family protein [Armatimonadetes bacterium]|nr:MlaD family protein [Armatimonadota bacterium]MCX7968455.1 MlaD family protein [Armatimonadota bacterium]MDW8142782.1 MlaD family protein [Armatimonadota bacterium]
MTARPESAFWSGVLILAGLAVLVGSTFYLRSFLMWRTGHWFVVEFNKAMGLEVGSDVLLQGMRVGTVDKVELSPPNIVRVVVRLEKDVPVYHPPASEITIRFGTLIGQPYVDIVNRRVGRLIERGEKVRGIDPVSWEELVPQARELANSLNSIIGDPQFQQNLRATVADLAVAAHSLRTILSSIPANEVKQISMNIRRVSERLNELASDKRLDSTLSNIETATRQLAEILSDPKIKGGIARTIQEAEQVLRSVRRVVGDEETQRNLKALAENLRESSEALKKLLSEEGVGGELEKVLAEARATISAAREVIDDPEVKIALKTTARNLAELTGRGHDVLTELEASLKRLRELVEGTQDNLEKMTEHLKGITQDLDETLDAIKWLMTEGGLKENLKQVGENLRATSENLKETTASVRELLTSEETKSSLKQGLEEIGPTIATVRQTAERGRKVLERLEKATNLQTHVGSSVWFVPEFDEVRGEAWTLFETPLLSPVSLLAGTYTGKEGTRVNLQIQGKIGSKILWRFGSIRSKLGVGIGWGTDRLRFDVEAYAPDNLQINSWLRWQLSPSILLRFGVEDLGRNRTLGVGIEVGRR